MHLNENEEIDIIPGTDLKIIQNRKRFSYGTDAIFLSSFGRPKGLVLDIGTGTGIVALRLWGRNRAGIEKIYGVEIQDVVAEMAKRSVALNGLEDKLEVLHMDLKDLGDKFGRSSIDTIYTNPPYMKSGGALLNGDENFSISRHELKASLEDIVRVASDLLKPNGRFYMVHRPNRMVDIIYYMRKYRLEPKYIRLVQPRRDKSPNLLLIEGVKHAKEELKFYDPLIIYEDNGDYTQELRELYYGAE